LIKLDLFFYIITIHFSKNRKVNNKNEYVKHKYGVTRVDNIILNHEKYVSLIPKIVHLGGSTTMVKKMSRCQLLEKSHL